MEVLKFIAEDLAHSFRLVNEYGAIDLICFLLIIVYIRSVSSRLTKHEVEHTIPLDNKFDMVKVTGLDIEKHYSPNTRYTVPDEIPPIISKFIKMFTSLEISKYMMEISSNTISEDTILMVKRGLTLSAALNNSVIPKQMVHIDNLTKAYWVKIRLDYQPQHVTIDDIKVNDPCEPVNTRRSANQTIDTCVHRFYPITGLVLRHAYLNTFPSIENFSKIINASRNGVKPYFLNEEEIKIAVTAFAIQSQTKIPSIYVSHSPLVLKLIRQVMFKAPKLSLVQDEPIIDSD